MLFRDILESKLDTLTSHALGVSVGNCTEKNFFRDISGGATQFLSCDASQFSFGLRSSDDLNQYMTLSLFFLQIYILSSVQA